MTALFLTVLRMSATASVAIAAVLLARLLLRKAPKKYAYLLWTVVGFRLICPVSLHSTFSLFSLRTPAAPAAIPSPPISTTPPVTVQTVPAIGTTTPVSPEIVPVSPPSVSPAVNWLAILALTWIIGMILLAGYSIIKELRLRRMLSTATLLEDNVYCSEAVRSPFVLGVLHPRIYIPYGLTDEEQRYVLAHEHCHLRRLDHITRRIAFLLLTLHWFNPLCYAAFFLCGKDMELSCDESVLSQDNISKQAYSAALLSFAAGHRMFAPAPLAFGETGVKTRITNALHWKQPKVWVSLIAAIVCLTVLLACGLDPKTPQEDDTPLRDAIQLDAPDGSAVLHFQPTGEKELALVQITDPDGTPRVKFSVSFQDASGATSAWDPIWLDSGAMAVTCHINPSTAYFLVYDAADGHLLNSVLGNDFLPVPGTRDILYAQSGPHFSDAQVPRLLVNDQELYRGSEPDSSFYELALSPDGRTLTFQLRSAEADTPETTVSGVYNPAERTLTDVTSSRRFPFEDILGFSGFYQDLYQSPSFLERTYYAQTENGVFPIGYSFGGNDDHVADLDGDGVTELICNCVYGADGAQRVYLYTNRDGQILQGTLNPTLPSDYENWGANSIQERYDPDTHTFQLLYAKADKFPGKQQYTMQDFTFVPFVPDRESPIAPGSTPASAPLLQTALQDLQDNDDWTELPVSVQRVGMTQAGKPSAQSVTTPVTLLRQLPGSLLSADSQEQGNGIHLQLNLEEQKCSVELWPSAQIPGRVLLRYHGPRDRTADREDAAVQNEALYLWLLALQNSEVLEVHDLDNDGFEETLLFGKDGQLTIYDWYDHRPQVIEVNDLLGQQVSFTGLTANIGDAYKNSFSASSPNDQMLFAYRDGTFTKLCTFQEAQSRYFREIPQAVVTQ